MALTDQAVTKIRELIRSGDLRPGARLAPEAQLSAQLGLSRTSLREAVKMLSAAGVLDVRRGDGTYVTSLSPRRLLANLESAVDLLQDDTLLEVMEVRRLIEPPATRLAALRITDSALDELSEVLERMRAVTEDVEELLRYDIEFHRAVMVATDNDTLTVLLDGLSSRTARARVWRGLIESKAAHLTLREHEAIYQALRNRDSAVAAAAALVHVNTSESWLRSVLSEADTA
ncbi:FadR/GntR family transcriptional regulator [Streptomyces sp. MA15]|uniref:FadR/GntR family transcriptional regulator n=1 Tax=Streptomyces sp. MA15 TaxID=3055061 RepID=UPI0025B189E5|nr:FadR/GntR family transcriptional regulator [Streptomyces sp. MA15]MDN3270160.1 FadR/GntR family transcriptional regulator [Streptomyces sp. MA15]